MRILPIEIIISKDYFKIGIFCIYYNEGCYSWDLLSFSMGKKYEYYYPREYRAFQFLGEIAEVEYYQDLSKCPECGGPADNGHDRCDPPSPYTCTKCEKKYFVEEEDDNN